VLFPTYTFAIFFVLVLGVAWRLRSRITAWKIFMLAASLVFYGWWDVRFVALLGVSVLFTTVMGMLVGRAQTAPGRRWAVRWGVIGHLVVLGFFKYWGFFVDSLITALRPLGLAPTPLLFEVALPIGVSFFTFCAISYLVDIGRGDIEPSNLLDVGVYLSFFPHLVAGPIVRASEFLPQLLIEPDPLSVDATRALRLIARGLFKKVVIANVLAQSLVDPVFAAPTAYGSVDIIAAILGYAAQIYADFSGYTDIALGVALLLGIRFPENFDRPYAAISLSEFWRRWHMTLSRWLRDYVYIPLGGDQRGARRTSINLLATMALGGLWHGAQWTFVIWGTYHGVALVIERWGRQRRRLSRQDRLDTSPRLERLREELGLSSSHGDVPTIEDLGVAAVDESVKPSVLADRGPADQVLTADTAASAPPAQANPWPARLATFSIVAVGWVLFRSQTVGDAGQMLWRAVSAWRAPEVLSWSTAFAILVGLGAQLLPPRVGLRLEWEVSRMPPIVQAVGFTLVLLAVDILGPQGVAPFIYFQF